jgi:hypothetical protein
LITVLPELMRRSSIRREAAGRPLHDIKVSVAQTRNSIEIVKRNRIFALI